MTSEFLPEDFRENYSMYLTKPDDELVKKYEKFVLDPYFAPLMAESLASELHTFNTKNGAQTHVYMLNHDMFTHSRFTGSFSVYNRVRHAS